MSAGAAVRAALAARLRGSAGVPVFEGEVQAGALPRVEVGEPAGADWSAVGVRGRELRTAVLVRVADGQRGRLGALTAAAELAGEGLVGDIGGWRVAGAVFLRSRVSEAKGVCTVLVEHRVRVVEV